MIRRGLGARVSLRRRRRRRRGERGQVTPLIVGFALIIALTVAVVIDATAAYLQRSELSTLADGAALHGADLGATGVDVYTDGLPDERLRVTEAQVRVAVADYLRQVGAHGRFPGLTFSVGIASDQRVTVNLSAPLDLPLTFPGAPSSPRVGASGSAVSSID